QEDWHTVSQISHSLKSTYGNIGIRVAAQATIKIEEISSKKTNFQELDNLMEVVTETTDKVIAIFQEQLQSVVNS
ncbi:MAG: hypothetical protein M3142_07160, partial [Bacteroidota bacterium]|nr:hypothetical protein [Bacteroidota bacterium]